MHSFAETLKNLRKKRNISQKRLSEVLNVSQKQISKYEAGKDIPSLTALLKLAEYLCVTFEYLLGLECKNNVEKVWMQNYRNQRLRLFSNPDSAFSFVYFADGEEKKSIFSYSFGIFPGKQEDHDFCFASIFLAIEELEGDYLWFQEFFLNVRNFYMNFICQNHLLKR